MRTVIYARFSSQLQDARSINDQVRVCRERAAREGWQITAVYHDYAISGAIRERAGLNQCIAAIESNEADQVLSEALDRISRHQGDLSNIYERIQFAGGRIFTLSEGEIAELEIGFKGTMAAMFRRDLADKIRRGQSGRVAAGRIPGNLAYGYRKIISLDARGEPERGLREVQPDQAEIVRRIFREYADGKSPIAIARALNQEGIPAPAGGLWCVSMINGDRVRGNGILHNEIYIGMLVYNRTTMQRDPQTRKRRPKVNPRDLWQRQPVPGLRIVDQDLWDEIHATKAEQHGWAYSRQKRPQKLLSGLIRCGQCGSPFNVVSATKWGCAGARRTGICTNRRMISNDVVENRVLAGIRRELLSPERVSMAVKRFHETSAKNARASKIDAAKSARQLTDLDRQIERLVSAIANGADGIPEVITALQSARAQKETIESHIKNDETANVIMLHPAIASAYREAVSNITSTVADHPDQRLQAFNAIRSLVDQVILTPKTEPRGLDVEVIARLGALMSLANGEKLKRPRQGTAPMVAEEGLEPPTPGL